MAINNVRSWTDRKRSDTELFDQVSSVMRLSRTFGLSISLVRLARRDDPASHDFNCFMWAFGLLDKNWMATLNPERQRIYPRSDFVAYLVRYCLQEISQLEMRTGDAVIYFTNGKPVHAGTWDSGLVVSK